MRFGRGETRMSRYVNDLRTTMGQEQASQLAAAYLRESGFDYREERGEMVWRKGVGWLAAPQFVKCEANDNAVHLEAWIAGFAFLPGVYAGEQSLQGVYGWAIKSALKAKVTELERRLSQGAAMDSPPAAAPVAPADSSL